VTGLYCLYLCSIQFIVLHFLLFHRCISHFVAIVRLFQFVFQFLQLSPDLKSNLIFFLLFSSSKIHFTKNTKPAHSIYRLIKLTENRHFKI
jgi:hypothetical protein